MTKKYFDGVIPAPTGRTEFDSDLIATAKRSYEGFVANMDAFKVADALDSAMTLARRANKYIDETTPWTLAKDESRKDELATVIYNLLESLRILGVLFGSSMPEASAKYSPPSAFRTVLLKAPQHSVCFPQARRSANRLCFLQELMSRKSSPKLKPSLRKTSNGFPFRHSRSLYR